ncbi:MAG: hypothetical protein LEGION0403_FIIPPAGN_00373 [Legionella sp.]
MVYFESLLHYFAAYAHLMSSTMEKNYDGYKLT